MKTAQRKVNTGRFPLVAGFLASVLSVACCVGPLLLVSLGLGGAWASRLAALDPYRPWFVGLSLLFLGWGIWSVRQKRSRSCGGETVCRTPVKQTHRMVWWIVLLSLLVLAFPWYAKWVLH
jgi:mercuric ion transport protein